MKVNPFLYCSKVIPGGKKWSNTPTNSGTVSSKRYKVAFGPASNVYAT